jgi:hypothetical protein
MQYTRVNRSICAIRSSDTVSFNFAAAISLIISFSLDMRHSNSGVSGFMRCRPKVCRPKVTKQGPIVLLLQPRAIVVIDDEDYNNPELPYN